MRVSFRLTALFCLVSLWAGACQAGAQVKPASIDRPLPTQSAAPAIQRTVRITGSDVVLGVMMKLALPLEDPGSEFRLVYQTERSASLAVQNLADKTVDVAVTLRDLLPEEVAQYPDLAAAPLAVTGLAVVTNPAVDLPGLSLDQLRRIYTGEITNFKQVGGPDHGITPYSYARTYAVYQVFEERVMTQRVDGEPVTEAFLPGIPYVNANSMVPAIAADPGALGYVILWELNGEQQDDPRAKVVPLGGKKPDLKNLLNGVYPLPVPLNLVTNRTNAAAQAFIQAMAGSRVRELVDRPSTGGLLRVVAAAAATPPAPQVTPAALVTHPAPSPSPLPTRAPDDHLTLMGSISLLPGMQEIASVFMQDHPGVEVLVLGGHSLSGAIAAAEGAADVGMVSAEIHLPDDSLPTGLEKVVIGSSGIVVVTHPTVDLPNLSLEDLRRVFAGEVDNYSMVEGSLQSVTPIIPAPDATYYDIFNRQVMMVHDYSDAPQIKRFSPQALVAGSTQEQLDLVQRTPGGITFLPLSLLPEAGKPISINGVSPTLASINSGAYPIVTPVYLLIRPPARPILKDFLDFTLSPRGQFILAKYFVPLP